MTKLSTSYSQVYVLQNIYLARLAYFRTFIFVLQNIYLQAQNTENTI